MARGEILLLSGLEVTVLLNEPSWHPIGVNFQHPFPLLSRPYRLPAYSPCLPAASLPLTSAGVYVGRGTLCECLFPAPGFSHSSCSR